MINPYKVFKKNQSNILLIITCKGSIYCLENWNDGIPE